MGLVELSDFNPLCPVKNVNLQLLKKSTKSVSELWTIQDGNPLNLHFVMFIPTLAGQGTVEQVFVVVFEYLHVFEFVYLLHIALNSHLRWGKFSVKPGTWGWSALMHRCTSSSIVIITMDILIGSFWYKDTLFQKSSDGVGPRFVHPRTWAGGDLPWGRSTVWTPFSNTHLLQGGGNDWFQRQICL